MKGRPDSLDKGPWYTTINLYCLSLSLAQKGTTVFTKITKYWGKGNNKTILRLLDSGSELTQFPGDKNLTMALQFE